MPIDPRIPLGVQPAPIANPLDLMQSVAALQGVREQTELRRLAAEEARRIAAEKAEARRLAQQEDEAFRTLLNDPQATPEAFLRVNPERGEKIVTAMNALQAARTQQVKDKFALGGQVADGVAALPPSEWPQAYEFSRNELLQSGVFTAEDLPPYSPAVVTYLQRRGGKKTDDSSFTLSAGQTRYGPTGEVIASAPAKAEDETFTLSAGQTRFGPGGAIVASVPAAPRDERLVQVQTPNGPVWVRESQAVGRPAGAAPGEAGAVKLTPAQQEDVATMLTVQDLGKEALALGEQIKWRGVGPVGGRTGELGARYLGLGGEQPERLRNLIGNIQGTIAKLRGGASFTPAEQKMLDRYTPTTTDSVLQIKAKLSSLNDFITTKRENTLRVAAGQYTPRAATPPADPLGIR